MDYSEYRRLLFERRDNGVLLVTINRPDKLNAADADMLREFTEVWADIQRDDDTRVVVITGAGKAFSAGGDMELDRQALGDFSKITSIMREARELVSNILACDKAIISAINGVAVGAGLAVALLADISIIGEEVRLTDGHARIGVAAGDHATIVWPLLCGMAKAKYYLMTGDFIDGREAERIGLVTKALPQDQVVPHALEIADRLAVGPRFAIEWTKRSLNHWIRNAQPIFEGSLALEMLTFFSPDAKEGFSAFLEKRGPTFG
jgi:enoyl-CoA hydratase